MEACSASSDCSGGLLCNECPPTLKDQKICTRYQTVPPTSVAPAVDTLREVEAFLANKTSEIVTIFIEDYVERPNAVTDLFTNANLGKYWFPVSKMPLGGGDWPTITEMIQNNWRLIVFTSVESKEKTEGIAYQWRYIMENKPGDGGMEKGSCRQRDESAPLGTKKSALFLQNYFPTFPDEKQACRENSASLDHMVDACFKAAGDKMPNFLAVNFYMRSDGGGVFDAIERMNAHTICGCNAVQRCQSGMAAGACKSGFAASPAGITETTQLFW